MTRIDISLVTLGDPNTPTGGYLYHRRMADAAPRHGASIEFISFPGRVFPLPALSAWSVLRKLRARAPDVVLLDSIAAAFAAPWLATTRMEFPIVAIVHQPPGGIDHGGVRTFVQAALDRLAYRRVTRFLVASRSLVDDLRRAGIAGDRIVFVAPGKDVAHEPADDVGDLRAGTKAAFLCVGNWMKRKGIVELLDAFATLAPRQAMLHLVGDDRADAVYARRVRDRLSRPELRDRVVWHGVVDRRRVAGMYAAADVFVLPSYTEPYGTVYGEAMAFGLAVVGWRAGNLPYLATHDKEGLLLTPGDVEGLAQALRRLADDDGLRRRLGEAAARRADSLPTWDETAALFFESIRAVADKG